MFFSYRRRVPKDPFFSLSFINISNVVKLEKNKELIFMPFN